MKNNYKKLFAFLLTGCIVFGGCGAPQAATNTETQNNTENAADTETQNDAENNTESEEISDNTDNAETAPASDASGDTAGSTASTGSSTFNTTFPSASTEPVIPPPLTVTESEQAPVIT